MRVRRSLHIGCATTKSLLRDFSDVLQAPEEAKAGAQVARDHGFEPRLLLTPDEVTAESVMNALREIRDASPELDLFLSYTGHGMQKVFGAKEQEGPCPEDEFGAEEFWVLNNSFICDNSLANFWNTLPSGTRVLVVADCCHGAGSIWPEVLNVVRRLPGEVDDLISRIEDAVGAKPSCPDLDEPDAKNIRASVVLLASTRADGITKPGLMTALNDALAIAPANFPEWVEQTNKILATRPDGPESVVTCRFGIGADDMWNGGPLS